MRRVALLIGAVCVLAFLLVYVTGRSTTGRILLLPSSPGDIVEVEPSAHLLPKLAAIAEKLRDRGTRVTRSFISTVTGVSDRWAELCQADGSVQFAKWWEKDPALASLHRRKAPSRELRLVIQKKPSLFYLAPEATEFALLPCVVAYAGDVPLKVYPAALGFPPEGDKEQQGDGRTPEGDFRICEKNAKSQFYKSLRLSYPEQRHADAGLKAKLISQDEHTRIVQSHRRKRTPPQNTALGGDLMIHGGGVGTNWTLGCVAMRNEDLDELFEKLPLRTKLTVLPAR